jgi:type VI secretion system protein VasD
MTARDARHLTGLILAVLVMAACKSNPPKPNNSKLALQVAADVNPDQNNRPSPVVVRVYQLKDSAKFTSAGYFELSDDAAKALGPDLIKVEEHQLKPGENITVGLAVAGDAKFVGVVAAFRNFRDAQWRVVVPAPLKKNALIVVAKNRVDLSSR